MIDTEMITVIVNEMGEYVRSLNPDGRIPVGPIIRRVVNWRERLVTALMPALPCACPIHSPDLLNNAKTYCIRASGETT
jgi:hypothetical protein